MTIQDTTRDSSSFTFAVDDVQPGTRRFAKDKIHERLAKFTKRRVEACCDYHTEVCCNHSYQPLLAAVYSAYCHHLPLVLGPDAVWLTIAQGVAHHMAIHGESLRRRFVSHDGKIELKVLVDGWIPNSPENPWEEAFESWTGQIKDFVGEELYQTLLCDFSTTDKSSRVASQVVMMDIFEKYFKYRVVGICGIPAVTLCGTEEDWLRVASKVRALRAFDMDWWLDALIPLVDCLAEARRGIVNVEHWRNICKRQEAYGGDEINGWIAYFFPYLREPGQGTSCPTRNSIFEDGRGFSTLSAPTGLSQVPIAWQHVDGNTRLMNVLGGLVGLKQNVDTLALEPIAGWAVCEAAPLDALLHEVKDRIASRRPIPSQPTSEPTEVQERYAYYLPDDLDRFFQEIGHQFLLAQCGSDLPVEFQFPGMDAALEWDEEPEEYGSSYGPYGRSWFKIAKLNNSQFLAINLDPNCRSEFFDLPKDRSVPHQRCCPIAVCSNATVGCPAGNPVIAVSFSELAQKLLHNVSTSGYFWETADFQPYCEAHAITRVCEK